ncbi:MAG: beta/alpha barrel domain-containing protein [Minisyncoccota bacterium]
MSLVVPAVLPASKEDLDQKLALFASLPSVSRIQIDAVDGKFASPASWPYNAPAEMRALVERGDMLPELDRITYEIDLMCLDADVAASAWLALGASRLTFHAESAIDLSRLLDSTRCRYGDDCVSFGLALNLASDLALIEPYVSQIAYVQFMGIATIGRQGQLFDPRVFEKIRAFHARHPELPLQVDGGVTLDSAKKLIALGVSDLVVGSAILRASDPAAAYAAFELLQSPYA